MAGSRALGDPRVPPPPPAQDGCVRLLDPGSVPRDCCEASITAGRLGLRGGGGDAGPPSCPRMPPTPPQPLRGIRGQQELGLHLREPHGVIQAGVSGEGWFSRAGEVAIRGQREEWQAEEKTWKQVPVGLNGSREL